MSRNAALRDFGPTLAHEKLTELHGLKLSVETLRGWMIEDGIWLPRARRLRRSYPPRERRACRGELVQIDGSEHAWFEDRGPTCGAPSVFVQLRPLISPGTPSA